MDALDVMNVVRNFIVITGIIGLSILIWICLMYMRPR